MAANNEITTAEQLLMANLPGCDLIAGEVVMTSPAGFERGRVAARVVAALVEHVAPRNLGIVTAGGGFQLAHEPDTVRTADVAFVRAESLPSGGVRGFFHGPPDLVVEIVSFGDRAGEISARVQDWLHAGSLLVWVVDSEHQTVAIHRGPTQMSIVGPGDTLTAADVLPEFSVPVAEVFK